MAPRWRYGFPTTALVAVAVACSSSNPDGGPTPPWDPGPLATRYDEHELARAEITSAGGVVAAGGAQITIPAGALAASTVIVIKSVSVFGEPVVPGPFAGIVYRFEPEDVRFQVPVQVRVEVDRTKALTDEAGAFVLFSSPSRRNQWTARAAATFADVAITAETDHLSDWAPFVQRPTTCGTPSCAALASDDAGRLAVDCRFPETGGGVRCVGHESPYACTCEAQPSVRLTATAPPSAAALSVFATTCGAPCGVAPPDAEADASPPDASPPDSSPPPDAATDDAATDDAATGDAATDDAAVE